MISGCLNLLEGFRWSYSKLETAESCPFAFKKLYIDHVSPAENPFAQMGNLCHELLAGFALKKNAVYDLLPAFQSGFRQCVTAPWPPYPAGMEQRNYEKLCSYFRQFQGLGKTDILLVEQKLIGALAGRPFSGILDLVLLDEMGRLCIIDYKTSGMSAYSGKHLERHKHQLFLYACLYEQTYGKRPDRLCFDMIKEDRQLSFPWDAAQQEQSLQWADAVMCRTEKRMERYFESLLPEQQHIQRMLCKGFSASQCRKELGLSKRTIQRMLMEIDETALAICGQREPSGGFGCQYICSARQVCDEGGKEM